MTQWTIYDQPPGFVVREWIVKAGEIEPGRVRGARDLEAARDLIPEGLVRMERSPGDRADIVETWT